MSKVFTVAVVGGGIGRSHIVEGYLPNSDRYRVIALCDLDPERLNRVGGEFAIERRTKSFDDLLGTRAVSTAVNSVRNNGPELLDPPADPPPTLDV